MKNILICGGYWLVGVVVGLVMVFEIGLALFPWSSPTHEQLTLAEKNQRLWGYIAPEPTLIMREQRGAPPLELKVSPSGQFVFTEEAPEPTVSSEEILRAYREQYDLPPLEVETPPDQTLSLEEIARIRRKEGLGAPTGPLAPGAAFTLEEINDMREEMGLPPREAEAVPEPTAVPEPGFYTKQQIYDTRGYGPNRPECAFFRQHVLATEPSEGRLATRPETAQTLFEQKYWISEYGCTTIEERLRELEQAQEWEEMNDMHENYPSYEQEGKGLDSLYDNYP
jgi:hypothetical protein